MARKLLDASLYGEYKAGWPKQVLGVGLFSSRYVIMGGGTMSDVRKPRERRRSFLYTSKH